MDKKTIKKRDLKKEQVKTLTEKIEDAQTWVLTDYRGLTVNQINQLRNKIKAAGGELIIVKNTLLKIALSKKQLPVPDDQLKGPSAALFAYQDEMAPLKEIASSIKTLGLPKYKFGFFGKNLLAASEVENLASIPTRDILQVKIVTLLVSPISGIVSVLGANIRNLISVLDQTAKKRLVS